MRIRLTCIKRDIAKLEAQEELAQHDQRKAERLMDQIKNNDTEIEQRHLEDLNFVKEDNQVDQKEAVFDEHVNRVAELIECFEEFELPEKMPSTLYLDYGTRLLKQIG